MSNDDNTQTSHILFLKEQILRFASPIRHTHTTDDITDINENIPPKNHADETTQYGEGTTTKYGHVKVTTDINDSSINPVQGRSIKQALDNLKTELKNLLQEKLFIVTEHIEEWENDKFDDHGTSKYAVPTAKAVHDMMREYQESNNILKFLDGIDLARPLSVNENIDNMIDAGYFLQKGARNFSYGGETIYYTNALIKIERQANRIIQHVYSTSRIKSGEEVTYKINGSEYTRWGALINGAMVWNSWEVAYKPYTKTIRACNFGPGVDNNSDTIRVFENTSGFIIHWDQNNSGNDKYPISGDLYEYVKVCDFEPPLPITGPYVFGNLIGRFDIKIESENMKIRSTVNKGGRIIEMHETWFVPRNQ